MMILLMSVLVFPLAAQELTGKWRYSEDFAEDDMSGRINTLFHFNPDGTARLDIETTCQMKNDELGTLDMVLDIILPGTWVREGDQLTLKCKKNKATIDFELKGLDDFPKMVRNMVTNMVRKEITKEVLSEFDYNKFTIMRLTEDERELGDEDGSEVLRRVKR